MALYRGELNGHPSPSEAVASLLWRLAYWTGPDEARLDRIFRWTRPPFSIDCRRRPQGGSGVGLMHRAIAEVGCEAGREAADLQPLVGLQQAAGRWPPLLREPRRAHRRDERRAELLAEAGLDPGKEGAVGIDTLP